MIGIESFAGLGLEKTGLLESVAERVTEEQPFSSSYEKTDMFKKISEVERPGAEQPFYRNYTEVAESVENEKADSLCRPEEEQPHDWVVSDLSVDDITYDGDMEPDYPGESNQDVSMENNLMIESEKEGVPNDLEETDGDVNESKDEITTQDVADVKMYTNLDEMANDLGMSKQQIKDLKPLNSPDIEKWLGEKGGKIGIIVKNGNYTFVYENKEGIRVPYIEGHPRFPENAKHPLIADIDIGNFINYNEDKKRYMKELEDIYGLTEIPDGYELHHDSTNGILQLVKAEYHKEFRHRGGHSKYGNEEVA